VARADQHRPTIESERPLKPENPLKQQGHGCDGEYQQDLEERQRLHGHRHLTDIGVCRRCALTRKIAGQDFFRVDGDMAKYLSAQQEPMERVPAEPPRAIRNFPNDKPIRPGQTSDTLESSLQAVPCSSECWSSASTRPPGCLAFQLKLV